MFRWSGSVSWVNPLIAHRIQLWTLSHPRKCCHVFSLHHIIIIIHILPTIFGVTDGMILYFNKFVFTGSIILPCYETRWPKYWRKTRIEDFDRSGPDIWHQYSDDADYTAMLSSTPAALTLQPSVKRLRDLTGMGQLKNCTIYLISLVDTFQLTMFKNFIFYSCP